MVHGAAANGRGTGTRVLALVMVALVATSPACTIMLPIVGAGVGRSSAPAATPPDADPACADAAQAPTPACSSPATRPRAPEPAPRSRYGTASSIGAFLGFFAGLAIDTWLFRQSLRNS